MFILYSYALGMNLIFVNHFLDLIVILARFDELSGVFSTDENSFSKNTMQKWSKMPHIAILQSQMSGQK